MDILFRYFEQQRDNCLLSDIILTQTLIILLLLLGAHRLSTIKLFSINSTALNELSVTLTPTEVLNHSRKGKPLYKFEYRAYEDKTLYRDLVQGSLVKAWKEYHKRRAHILVPKTENEVEFLQSVKQFDKTPILNISEILAQTAFIEKDQVDDQNQ